MSEFLPLCDLLFNVVSLAAYFCDCVFDLLMVYSLYDKGLYSTCVHCLLAIVTTSLIIQSLSLYWYNLKLKQKLQDEEQDGAKQVERRAPDDKQKWRTAAICVLHIFQLGVVWRYAKLLAPVKLKNVKEEVRDLCILRLIHAFLQAAPMLLLQLSLLTKHESPPTDLVTVSASLSLFTICWALASFSKHVQKVEKLVLTWLGVLSQLLWRGGTVTARAMALSVYAASYHSWIFLVIGLHWACMFLWLVSPRSAFYGEKGKKLGICFLMAGIYVLAYINLHDKPHTRTMMIFYGIMLFENLMLVTAWLAAIWAIRPPNWMLIPTLSVVLFMCGLFFMLVYYRFFHIKRILEKPTQPQGVFNCRFVGPTAALYNNRKKKKPTSFVPPPGLAPMTFWRRPLPSSSENEGSSVGSRVNIHQKLQEKKQKQLAELKIIEEEIKQGKLVGPEGGDPDDRQPIPCTKRHLEPQLLSLASLNNLASYGVNLNRRPAPRAPRSRTPELLLAPRYLYCDCPMPEAEVEQNNSDIESQLSLPRSYTLPREFKYYRRGKTRRPVRQVASTNSSDGDVDSAEDEEDFNVPPVLVRPLRRPQYRHETKL
ncbi:XK-related protein 7-like [Atheta coriaria]|uniref:XK-related protein 7-like n=1 Tax=Dalotia coriaria TaxID=877792 RepID=UPI0031F3AC2E